MNKIKLDNWELKQIKDIAPLQRGFDLPSHKIIQGKYPVVYSNGILKFHSSFKVKGKGVVTGRSGTIGKVTFVESDFFPHNTTLWVTNFKGNYPKFIYYLYIFLKLETYSSGTGVPTLNRNDIHSILIAIPKTKKEQELIAKSISDIDNLINKLETLIEKKKNIKKGAMQELLTGKRRLEGFSEKWGSKLLGDMLDYEQPTKYLVKNTEYDDKYNTPVLTAGKTFILGYTNEENNTFQNVPVIIFDDFTTSSKYVDFSFKAKSSAMKILKPKNENVNLKFVYERMQLINFPSEDHKRYWISEFSNLLIKVPEFEEQNKISQIISDMELEIKQLETQKKKYVMIKEGMIQKLLTGEIRIK
jgi:type I restriction enzyme, S subunit